MFWSSSGLPEDQGLGLRISSKPQVAPYDLLQALLPANTYYLLIMQQENVTPKGQNLGTQHSALFFPYPWIIEALTCNYHGIL